MRTPTAREQREQWLALLGADHADVAADLAAPVRPERDSDRHRRPVRDRVARKQPIATRLRGQLWDACLASARPRLDVLAERVEPKAAWDDLILAPEPMGLLRLIAEQERHRSTVYDDWGVADRMNRGLGITALFAGESGTGKTMAAEVIADELRLNLYRIDLSAVVSKYIGETEKNLRRLFDAAESGGTILFFDEADALFGKRSEVKDSHDRYANIEINYLLQRMEQYCGLAILATNMKSALDTAFVRRLRFVVEFPFPAAPERERIWRARVRRGRGDRRARHRVARPERARRRQHPQRRHRRDVRRRVARRGGHDAARDRGHPAGVPEAGPLGQRGGSPLDEGGGDACAGTGHPRGSAVIVRIHIERLVVDGPVHQPVAGEQLRAAVASELARTVRERGLPTESSPGGAVVDARGPDLDAGAWASTAALASGIAGSVHAASAGVLGR